jgi:hypothetical protein
MSRLAAGLALLPPLLQGRGRMDEIARRRLRRIGRILFQFGQTRFQFRDPPPQNGALRAFVNGRGLAHGRDNLTRTPVFTKISSETVNRYPWTDGQKKGTFYFCARKSKVSAFFRRIILPFVGQSATRHH